MAPKRIEIASDFDKTSSAADSPDTVELEVESYKARSQNRIWHTIRDFCDLKPEPYTAEDIRRILETCLKKWEFKEEHWARRVQAVDESRKRESRKRDRSDIAQPPTPHELAEAEGVIRHAIEANQAALIVFKTIFERPWPIATDAPGNLFEQVFNVVTNEKQGLQWVIADMTDVLNDIAAGPDQGQWVKNILAQAAAPAASAKKSPRGEAKPGKNAQPLSSIQDEPEEEEEVEEEAEEELDEEAEEEEFKFGTPQLPTPFELADAEQVIRTAIEANRTALATFKMIFERPWVIATAEPGNLFEQVYNIVTNEKQGLMWVIADMEAVLEDIAEGPEQGDWVKQVFMPQPEAPKSKRRFRHAAE